MKRTRGYASSYEMQRCIGNVTKEMAMDESEVLVKDKDKI